MDGVVGGRMQNVVRKQDANSATGDTSIYQLVCVSPACA
jgi:hypothetical protein